MPIKITILGSGTGVPSLKRSACSVLMEIETDKLLFDLGAGTMRRLLEAGLSITQVTYLFFSHLHPDHTGEFASFLFATKYFESRNIPLVACGAKGLEEFYSRLRNAF
ncbi:MAG: MBL fold metallo-hydrolase, partial [Syntrophales bacterium]